MAAMPETSLRMCNLAGRVIQPVEGDGRTNAGAGKHAKKLKKKPTVPVITDEQQAHDGRAEGDVHAGGVVGEEDDEEHEYNGQEADEDDTIIAHSPQTPVHSPQRSLQTRNTELQVQAHWERVIREQFAASMRKAIASTKADFLLPFTAEGPPSGSSIELGYCHTEADDSGHHELQIHRRSSKASRAVGGATTEREFDSL